MAQGIRRIMSTILGIIIADTALRYVAPAFGIDVPFTSSELMFIVFGAVCTALVADFIYKKSYKSLEEKYMDESNVIIKNQ
jgi:hypothetical protein